MNFAKVLITGATGFIGSRLCEKLRLQYGQPYRALVRNFSSAARIARLGAEMVPGDLADGSGLDDALSGCDAVVHLAYGGARRAEQNLVAASRRANIKRFVHISSMAVHGPRPGPECTREETATIGRYNERYSDSKARAERIVQRAIAAGLPGVILRPTIVYGPYSPFVTQIVNSAKSGRLTLLDGGSGVCNAVYVDDVCDAIYTALHCDRALGKAFFVNADRTISWKEFNLTFANMISPPPRVGSIPAAEARAHWAAKKPSVKSNISAFARLIASSDFHDQLATVPALHTAMAWTKGGLKKILSADRVVAFQRAGSPRLGPVAHPSWPDRGRIVREDFHLEFSNERARRELGWKPAFDFSAGASLTCAWLDFAGMLRPATAHV
ncbi:MAG TPA: NAD-dependent epimerase/dehydratase family protein [Rhizomicrobium sp.]|jgi:nucleoside-diphosphate-sugar epimerase|nr:NAD-dependent epimerase/dehydratase family protein [Rhizomicrobium sp.]